MISVEYGHPAPFGPAIRFGASTCNPIPEVASQAPAPRAANLEQNSRTQNDSEPARRPEPPDPLYHVPIQCHFK
jgi:hypothetical protein